MLTPLFVQNKTILKKHLRSPAPPQACIVSFRGSFNSASSPRHMDTLNPKHYLSTSSGVFIYHKSEIPDEHNHGDCLLRTHIHSPPPGKNNSPPFHSLLNTTTRECRFASRRKHGSTRQPTRQLRHNGRDKL